jgi:CRISPR/Cas system CSM-associated protein Csm2 small subunit
LRLKHSKSGEGDRRRNESPAKSQDESQQQEVWYKLLNDCCYVAKVNEQMDQLLTYRDKTVYAEVHFEHKKEQSNSGKEVIAEARRL